MNMISSIVPIFKVEKYMQRCINSILYQTYNDFELILIDDGTPDQCGGLCDEYCLLDSRICVIHKSNGGLSDARNAGINYVQEISPSDWITFIDSDDWVNPDYLRALHQSVVQTDCCVSICDFLETSGRVVPAETSTLSTQTFDSESFFCENHVNAAVAWGKLYKKELFQTIRYPVGRLHEDEFTTYKLLFKNSKLAVISEKLYYYYCNPNSITRLEWNYKRLDVIDAFMECSLFFKRTEYDKAYRYSLERVICLSYDIYCKQKDFFHSNPEYMTFLRKKMRKALILDKKYFPFRCNQYLYEIAYPKIMRLYWIACTIKTKIIRK